MKTIALTLLAALTIASAAQAAEYRVQNGYYRSNGTYVAPHMKTNPNGQTWDNLGGN